MHRNCAHCLKEIGSEIVGILNLSPCCWNAKKRVTLERRRECLADRIDVEEPRPTIERAAVWQLGDRRRPCCGPFGDRFEHAFKRVTTRTPSCGDFTERESLLLPKTCSNECSNGPEFPRIRSNEPEQEIPATWTNTAKCERRRTAQADMTRKGSQVRVLYGPLENCTAHSEEGPDFARTRRPSRRRYRAPPAVPWARHSLTCPTTRGPQDRRHRLQGGAQRAFCLRKPCAIGSEQVTAASCGVVSGDGVHLGARTEGAQE